MSEYRDILREELQDPEYRHAYAEDFLNTSIATQIRVLREQRRWTQEELAEKIRTKQAGISHLENVNYSVWKTETLRKIAWAYDVRLRVTFETFGTLLNDAEEFSRKALERVDFDHDPVFHQTEPELVASEDVPSSKEAETSDAVPTNGGRDFSQPIIETKPLMYGTPFNIGLLSEQQYTSVTVSTVSAVSTVSTLITRSYVSSGITSLGQLPVKEASDEEKINRQHVGPLSKLS